MYNSRTDSRKSLYALGKIDKVLAEEFLYIEATMEMICDAIESLSAALEEFSDKVEDLTETAYSINEKIQELSITVTEREDENDMQRDNISCF